MAAIRLSCSLSSRSSRPISASRLRHGSTDDREVQVVRRVRVVRGVPVGPVAELVERELPDAVQHPEPRLGRGLGLLPDQAALHQPVEGVHHVVVDLAVGAERADRASTVRAERADGLRRLQGEAPGEYGQPAEHRLLAGVEQVVAPADGVPQCALPVRQVARAAGEQLQRAAHPLQDGRRRQHPDLRRRELDRQGQALQPPADLHHRGQVLLGQGERAGRRPGPVDEQPHRAVVPHRVEGDVPVGDRQRLERERVLTADPHRRPAGHQGGHAGRAGQDVGEHRRRLGDVFEVVDHQQHLPGTQERHDVGDRSPGARRAQPEGPGDRVDDEFGRVDRGQLDVADPVGEQRAEPLREVGGQPGLADPARPGERDEPHILVGEQLGQGGDLQIAVEHLGTRDRDDGRRCRLRRGPTFLEPLREQHRDVVLDQPAQLPGVAEAAERHVGARPRCPRSARPAAGRAGVRASSRR